MSITLTIIEPNGTTTTAGAGTDTSVRALIKPHFPDTHYEHVTVLHDGERADMFVDEDGHRKGLPRNETATAIYRNNWLTQHPDTNPETMPFIVGRAVLSSERIWF